MQNTTLKNKANNFKKCNIIIFKCPLNALHLTFILVVFTFLVTIQLTVVFGLSKDILYPLGTAVPS